LVYECKMVGHRECKCESCKADKKYAGKQYIRICGRCDGDY